MRTPIIIFLALALLGGMLWFGWRSRVVLPETPPVAADTNTHSPGVEPVTNRTARVFSRAAHRRAATQTEAASESEAMEPWDGKIDQILAMDASEAEIGQKLLELYPAIPPAGQADLALEIAARTADADYSKLAAILTNSVTPADVVDVLVNDLLDRPDRLRLPLLLDLARSKDGAKAGEAKDLLEALVGQDYGEDWVLWSKKISEWLASHPE